MADFAMGRVITIIKIPRVGIEPTRCHHHWILSPARLPVPPPRQEHAQYSKLLEHFNGINIE